MNKGKRPNWILKVMK